MQYECKYSHSLVCTFLGSTEINIVGGNKAELIERLNLSDESGAKTINENEKTVKTVEKKIAPPTKESKGLKKDEKSLLEKQLFQHTRPDIKRHKKGGKRPGPAFWGGKW